MALGIGTYVKRPVEVEAVQVTDDNLRAVAEWCGGYEVYERPPAVIVRTLEGPLAAHVGNWVVRGVAGEFYPVRDDIFRQTYDVAALTEA